MMTCKIHTRAYMAWSCVVLFYFYQYILRVSSSVMADDLMSAFQVSASGFGSLSAFAVYSYGFMQIPMGIFVDYYGIRRTILASITLCITGVVLFSFTETLIIAYIARLAMGMGSASAFLSVSKIVTQWFPEKQQGMMMGLSAAIGAIGALAGGAPLVMLIERQGWRNSLLLLGLTGTGILLINLWGLPKVSLTPAVLRNRPTLFTDLIKIFKNTQVWLFGIVAVGIYLSISVVADLWGVSFVMEKFSIEKSQAAQMISLIYIGTTLGCILFPWIARETQSIRYPLFAGSAGVICLLSSLIYLPELSLGTGKMIFLGIGVFTGSEILCFIGACRLMEPDLIGTMSGFLNCIITLVGAIVQQNVGIVLDYFWDGKLTLDGIPHYSIYTYQVAFGVILFLTFISVFLSCFIKPYPMPLPHQN